MPNRLTSSERRQQARMASHSSWARTIDPAARTAPARQRFLESFERAVDPEGKLSEHTRKRLAEHARKAHFAALALKSAKARARKAGSGR